MFNFSQNSEYLSESEIIEILNKIDGGFKESSDPFFNDCNKLLKPFVKQGVISFEDEEDLHQRNPVVCNVQGCNQEFETVFAYETHYNTLHRYLCGQCKKSLPTPHLLDLHLSEQHDSFFAIQSQRQSMYACFIEECHYRSKTPEERKDHCITIHKFPSNYRFDTHLSGKSTKKQNKCQNIDGDDNQMDIVEDEENKEKQTDYDIQRFEGNKNDAENKLKNFSFGHTKMKTFSVKSIKKSTCKSNKAKSSALEDDETFKDLKDSLPDQS